MSIDLKSPWTLVLLIPDALRVAGRPDSTPSEVAAVILREMYGENAPVELLDTLHEAMHEALEMARAQARMSGATDIDVAGDGTISYVIGGAKHVRHVRIVRISPGTNPKRPLVDYAQPAKHGLELVAIEGDRAEDWAIRANKMERERDSALRAAELAKAAAHEAKAETATMAARVETWETEAIVIVPRNDLEDMGEMLRRRIRELERANEMLRSVIIEPDATLRRRIALEMNLVEMTRGLRDVIAALEGTASPVFACSLARNALAGAARTITGDGDDGETIGSWTKHTATFLAELAKTTGAQDHAADCGCQGCGAYLLLEHGARIGITWTEPTEEPAP